MTKGAFRHANPYRALQHISLLVLTGLLLTPTLIAQTVREFPPALPPTFAGGESIPVNGGRVQSIAVDPTNPRRIIAAHQFGGLWKTDDAGAHWTHVANLTANFVNDVAYAPDGRTVIATLDRDNADVNGGGIYISSDGGFNWMRPPRGAIPGGAGAKAISFAPDRPGRIYVTTQFGVAVSDTNGAEWNHIPLPGEGRSVLGLPNNVAIVTITNRNPNMPRVEDLFMTTDGGTTWNPMGRGPFNGSTLASASFKTLDVSPYDRDKVFFLQDDSTLALFEVATNRWTLRPLPTTTGGRPPFIRVARNVGGAPMFDIWVGIGATGAVSLYKAPCTDIDAVRTITASTWQGFGRGASLHEDAGHMGLDVAGRIVMYGSDGGLFKPDNALGTAWSRASLPGSGMNSYLITSVSETSYNPVADPLPSLRFGTQDNGVWGSSDGGLTWANNDCTEGWLLSSWHQARSSRDPESRVLYQHASCGDKPRTADAALAGIVDTMNVDPAGRPFQVDPGYSGFVLAPQKWIRLIKHPFQSPLPGSAPVFTFGIYVSTENAERWQSIGSTSMNAQSSVFHAAGPADTPTAYWTVSVSEGGGTSRIALVKLSGVLRLRDLDIRPGNPMLRLLPGGGDLGERATEFDWHPIYGVDPRDPDFLIVPDIRNQRMLFSKTGGLTWDRDDDLLNAVTQGGRLRLYNGDAYHMQVTEIAFSPYERNLILVGTRDAGVIYSENGGINWQAIPRSQGITYITGFAFRPNGTVVVSSYGRGLWLLDMRRRQRPFSPEIICGFNYEQCLLRLPPDAGLAKIAGFPWKEHNVLVVTGGQVNGIIRSGEDIKAITVTPNSSYRFYGIDEQPLPEIVESKEGAGFKEDVAAEVALKNGEVITGIVLKGRQVVGYLTSKSEFKAEQEPVVRKAPGELPADKPTLDLPYLAVHTESQLGPRFVQAGGEIVLVASGFIIDSPVDLLLDGKAIGQIKIGTDGQGSYTFKESGMALGEHTLEVVQKTPKGERKAVASFIKVRNEDRSEKQ
jgi:hypothetical protein